MPATRGPVREPGQTRRGGMTVEPAPSARVPAPEDPETARARRHYRLTVVEVPRARLIGHALLIVAVPVHNRFILGEFSWSSFVQVAAVLLSYSLLSWLVLYLFAARIRIVDLGTVFLVGDLAVWTFVVYHTGGDRSWLYFLTVIRVADQLSTTVRRVLVFAHLSVASYALLVAYLAFVEGRPVSWPAELAKLLFLYGANLYISTAAETTEAMRGWRRRAEEASRQSEQRYRDLFEDASDAIATVDADGRFASLNVAMERLLGYSRDEVLGQHYGMAVTPASRALIEDRNRRALAGERLASTYEIAVVRQDGRVIAVEARTRLLRDRAGQPTGALGIFRDVTERKRADEALRQAEQKYRGIFEHSREGIFQTTPEGRYLSANPALARIYGYDSPDELVTALTDIAGRLYVDPGRRDEFRRLVDEQGTVSDFESRVCRRDGRVIWISEAARAVRDEAGRLLYYEGTTVDITERKQAEEALRESARRYRSLFDDASDAIFVADMSGIITSVSRGGERLLGYPRKALIGRHYHEISSPASARLGDERNRRALAGEKLPSMFEYELVRSDGTVAHTEGRARFIRDRDGQPVSWQAMFRDVTERKQAEKALRENEERYRALFREAEESRQVLGQLYRIGIRIQTSRERDERVRAFIEGAHEVVGLDRIYVLLASSDGSTFEPVTGHGFDSPPVCLPVSPAAGPYYQAFVTRRPVVALRDEDLQQVLPIDPAYRDHPYFRSKRFVISPLLVGGRSIGVVGADNKPSRHPISPGTIEPFNLLCQQFAAALEETRLVHELEARTRELGRSVEELRGLGEVSQAVSSTLELQTVLTTISTHAVALSGASGGVIYEFDEATETFHLRATHAGEAELVETLRATTFRLGEGAIGQAADRRAVVQVADIEGEPGLVSAHAGPVLRRLGYRSLLAVPLLLEHRILGGLAVWRRESGSFPPEIVNLLQTFATQSVVAIRNARLFREIEEKSRQLEVASRHKSQFLANMSHELRTPLNAVIGYTELILDSIYGEVLPDIREVLQRIDHNGRHLLGLINAVLDLSKIEAGRLTLTLTDYSMLDVVQAVVMGVGALAEEKKLAVKISVAPDLPLGKGDERRITQVLLNLVGNAIKFTERGEVRVDATASSGAFRVSVSDTGPGIAEADQARIFEEFQQADRAGARKQGGTGLGLSIARRIVEVHGGRMWVESTPGQGATFIFTLPVRVERQAERA
jgi:PAS domain S-box-containing protein